MGSGINELYSLVLRFDSLLPLHIPIAFDPLYVEKTA
jgi:hypothetical protein